MDLIQALFLGLLQGVTEWLPISSQGQVMVAALSLFGVTAEEAFRHAITLHIGTLIAATVYFRKELVEIVLLKDKPLLKFFLTALIGSAITAIPIYLVFKGVMGDTFLVMLLVGAALILIGIIQFKKKIAQGKENVGHGFLTGLAQGIAVIPGISRSGITTAVLLMEDFDPEQAFRLSFLLSIPSVFAAEVVFATIEGISFEPNMLIAIAVAAIVGYASIDFLINIARKINFSIFCIVFGLAYIALAFI
ncbi:MAG: hypothetical protein CL943_02995 [Candidatus Diapherotrites archaeon]|uniref:Undecaprenyl-diphosphatase n=1 Tax=Candidatus Iainarchaeum sp. TaxID=3101447 RepID=A0A2D6M1F0_9ARCH|nr:hypothetical protein [Candidatus Diapherotrites archaeon]|tara:strand:- start:5174 stop:5920 length:747 start_codon:yes stop_codon:yes gene_type:complete